MCEKKVRIVQYELIIVRKKSELWEKKLQLHLKNIFSVAEMSFHRFVRKSYTLVVLLYAK